MPRDNLCDSLAVLRNLKHEDEENWPLEDLSECKQETLTSNSQSKNTKDECAYYNYGLGDGSSNPQNDPLYQFKTSSLPAAASRDGVVYSALRIRHEDIANQLTLLDLPSFKGIKADELTTFGWNKLHKLTIAPNVVGFTKRFNRVNFWTVQEILNGNSPKARAETLAHFIKVAQKLLDLNNLHSLFAIISALRSASIYRLTKTWACLSKKDKQQFDTLAELFCEKDNWTVLREYLNNISLPCIPYLGLFLTDLVYIDIANPVGSSHRTNKMAIVLKALERFQTSEYEIEYLPCVANYLNSVRYIEELQKFLEDDQYKLSLKLEPPSPAVSCASSKESVKETIPMGAVTPFSLSPPHKIGSGSLIIHGTYHQSKFIPTHRKSRSLGSNIFGKSHTEDKCDEKTPARSFNLLDDTLLESPGPATNDKMSQSLPHREIIKSETIACDFQSFVRRKTILKEGRKISLTSWQRYWMQISGEILVFFSSNSFKGTNRSDFRSERCKVICLEGWRAIYMDSESTDAFQMVNHQVGTLYKFKTGSASTAKQWVAKIEDVTNKLVKPLPANLMSFE